MFVMKENKVLKIFSQRIKDLREEQGKSLLEIAENTGISKSALHYYETCQREPSLSAIIKLSAYYNESIDYLIGETNNRNIKKGA